MEYAGDERVKGMSSKFDLRLCGVEDEGTESIKVYSNKLINIVNRIKLL